MLVLKRKAGESIIVNENIEIKIIEIEEGRIKIGIEAPKDVSILRKEVLDEAHMENKQSSENKNIDKKYFSNNGDGTWSANMCPASLSYKLENYVISIEEI